MKTQPPSTNGLWIVILLMQFLRVNIKALHNMQREMGLDTHPSIIYNVFFLNSILLFTEQSLSYCPDVENNFLAGINSVTVEKTIFRKFQE